MSETKPRVSVLLPAFDAASSLAAALRSVQRQTERRWECLIVDDGSTDETGRIAAQFAARDPRFSVLHSAHAGIVSALNAGVSRARGEFVARMDADDLMQRRRLELQLSALRHAPELAAVGGHVRLFPRSAMTAGLKSYEAWLNSIRDHADVAREAFVECPVAHPTLMLRRAVLLEQPYRDADWPEDYDLLLRLLERGAKIGVVPRRLLHWRDGSGRLSRTSARYSIAAFTRCKAEYLTRGLLRGGDRYVLWGFGDTGKALAGELAKRGKHPSAIVELHPGRLGQLIRGVRVVPPDALRALPRLPVVVSVAGLGPRSEIRAALASMNFHERIDFVCAA